MVIILVKFINFFLTDDKKFNYFILITLVVLFILIAFSKEIPLWFTFGQQVENILVSICLSIFSSYVFYALLILRKERKDKENISYLLNYKIHSILKSYEVAMLSFRLHIDFTNLNDLEESDFESFCTLIGTDLPTNNTMMYLDGTKHENSHEEVIRTMATNVHRSITEIVPLIPIMDTEVVKLILIIQDSTFLNNTSIKGLDFLKLQNFHKEFFYFHSNILKLYSNYDKNILTESDIVNLTPLSIYN